MQKYNFQKDMTLTETPVNVSQDERALSMIGGGIFLLITMLKRDRFSFGTAAIAATLLYRGITGISPIYKLLGINTAVHKNAAISVPHQQGIRVTQSITINRPVEEVYGFWRDFTNLPRLMPQLQSIEVKDATHSHWRIDGPAGMDIEWDAEIINDEPNSVIGWRSLQNPYVDHAGSVRFKPVFDNQSTEVQVEMEYVPVAGVVGTALTWLAGDSPQQQTYTALHRLKQQLEVGEIATTDGQSSGRAKAKA